MMKCCGFVHCTVFDVIDLGVCVRVSRRRVANVCECVCMNEKRNPPCKWEMVHVFACLCVSTYELTVGIEANKSVNQLCTSTVFQCSTPLSVFVHCICACVSAYCDVLKLLSAVIRLPFTMKLAPQAKSTPMKASLKVWIFWIFYFSLAVFRCKSSHITKPLVCKILNTCSALFHVIQIHWDAVNESWMNPPLNPISRVDTFISPRTSNICARSACVCSAVSMLLYIPLWIVYGLVWANN